MRFRRPGRWSLAAVLLFAGMGLLRAEDRHDHDRARAAVQAGEVQPLRQVLDTLHQTEPGEVLEVELEQDAGRWVYELKLLRPDGTLRRLKVDARTGTVLSSRTRPEPARPAQAASPAGARP
jgi:uncharacterized iron-regulated membrane protein